MRSRGDARWFVLWAIAGVLSAASITALVFVTLPVAVLLSWWLWRHDAGSGRLGFVVGLGALAMVIGAIHLDYRSCTTLATARQRASGSYACGGVNGPVWLGGGGLVTVAGAAAFLWSFRRT